MAHWKTIKQVSEKYGIAETTLRGWTKLGYITHSIINDVVMLDDESMTRHLDTHQIKGLSDDALNKLIKEKEWEREVILSRFDDELFLLKTQKLYEPLFHILIEELGQLITDNDQRDIFLSISSGEPISRVAARHQMTYDEVVAKYSSILDKLGRNPERITTFRESTMTSLFGKYETNNPLEIHLSQFINDRACHILSKLEIYTVYQLLQHASKYGWPSLKRLEGMGTITYNEIINSLYNANIIIINKDKTITLSPEIATLVL